MTKLTLAEASALLDRAMDAGIVTKGGGGWMSFGERKLVQGEQKTVQFLADYPDVAADIAAKLSPAGEQTKPNITPPGGNDVGANEERKPVKGDVLVVTAKRDQPRRRIGRVFHRREETIIAIADLNDDEIKALDADADLNVVRRPAARSD